MNTREWICLMQRMQRAIQNLRDDEIILAAPAKIRAKVDHLCVDIESCLWDATAALGDDEAVEKSQREFSWLAERSLELSKYWQQEDAKRKR